MSNNFKYSDEDIFNKISKTLYPRYKNLPIIPSKHAQEEMDNLGISLHSVQMVLTRGFDCYRSKRKPNIIERCLLYKDKILKVVVALVEWQDNAFWRMIHVGKISKHKFR